MIQQPHAIDLPNQAASEYLRPEPAAEFLRARIGQGSPKTLAKLRTIGGGPPFRKVGSRWIVYEVAGLIEWADAKISGPFTSTSAG
jgi:hypothetical protein